MKYYSVPNSFVIQLQLQSINISLPAHWKVDIIRQFRNLQQYPSTSGQDITLAVGPDHHVLRVYYRTFELLKLQYHVLFKCYKYKKGTLITHLYIVKSV